MIGVCIKYFHENYGGMLQAYATTKILEKRNIDYEIIRFGKKKNTIEKIRMLPRLFNGILLNDKYEAYLKEQGKKKHTEFARNDQVRLNEFHKFSQDKFIKLSPVFETYSDLCKGAKRYDLVVTGSDQLWSPAGLPTNFYNLMFVPDEIRKVSYASSFGVGLIPWYQKKRTKKYLDRIDCISMREHKGAEIVKKLTGRNVITILDPVFMLECDEWAKYIPNKREIDEPYIFAYFLGSNEKYRREISDYAKDNGLKIVTLRHLDQYIESDENFGDIAPYDVAPDRFLNFIRNAEYVFTDSFHGTCFSIIHKKKFVVYNRYGENAKHSKNSRIDTLCENFNLQNRRYSGNVEKDANSTLNYDSVQQILSEKRKEAEKYLDEALGE